MKGESKDMAKPETCECSIKELEPELHNVVKPYISEGERVLLCIETGSRFGIILSTYHYDASILTNKKIIVASASSRSVPSVTTIDLADISSISQHLDAHHANFVVADIVVHVIGGEPTHLTFRSLDAAQKFERILREIVEQLKTQTSLKSPKMVEERLRALTNLYKEGLVSESEFQQKRKEILGQL